MDTSHVILFGGVGPAPPAPELAFPVGSRGFWLDASNLGHFHRSVSDSTIPANYDEIIGGWRDTSPSPSFLAIAQDDSTKAILMDETVDGPFAVNIWARFTVPPVNGQSAGGYNTGFYFAGVIMGEGFPANGLQTIWSDKVDNTGFLIQWNGNDGLMEFSAGNGTTRLVASAGGLQGGFVAGFPKHLLECWWDGANLNIRINEGATTQTSCASVTGGSTTVVLSAEDAASTNGGDIHFYQCVYSTYVPSSGDRALIADYLQAKGGLGAAQNLNSDAQPTTYAVTGPDARGYTAKASNGLPGTYATTGSAATSATSVASQGGASLYATAGTATTVTIARSSVAASSSYTYTGAASAGSTQDIEAESPGLYQVTGSAASGGINRQSVAGAGLYTYAGYVAGGHKAWGSNAESSSYEQSGIGAEALKEIISAADPGTYADAGTGSTVTSLVGSVAEAGTYTTEGVDTGIETTVRSHYESLAESGAYGLTGYESLQALPEEVPGGVRVVTRTRRVVDRVREPVNRDAILNAERTGTSVVGLPGVPTEPAASPPVERIVERVVERIVYRDRDVIVESTEKVDQAQSQVNALLQQLEEERKNSKKQFALGLAAGFVAGED